MNRVNASIVEAPMGGGKTTVLTALCADSYFANIYSMRSTHGNSYEIKPYNLEIVELVKENRYVRIPYNWETFSTARIFCNYHLHGVKYVYCSVAQMLEWLNSSIVTNGKLGVDESYIEGEARKATRELTVRLTWFAQQMRKRELELFLLTQNQRFIDWRLRDICKRRILCKYNEKTYNVHLLIQNLVKGSEKMTHFYAPTYWKYFDTNELPPVPESIQAREARKVAERNAKRKTKV